jgi:hypothetical protein
MIYTMILKGTVMTTPTFHFPKSIAVSRMWVIMFSRWQLGLKSIPRRFVTVVSSRFFDQNARWLLHPQSVKSFVTREYLGQPDNPTDS